MHRPHSLTAKLSVSCPRSSCDRLIVQQQQTIERLQQEIERLKVSLQLDTQNSSKPPSSDLLKKPEKQKTSEDKTTEPKRKPGGQPGHPGKTRTRVWQS